MEKLRQRKKNLRAAVRALVKSGQGDSEAAQELKKKQSILMKAHNRLRAAVHKMNAKRKSAAAQTRFRKDPHAFAANLFKNTNNSAPTFSQDQAKEYFSKTYGDEGRDHKFEPPPGLERPKLPDSLFASRCPTLKELIRSVKRKSNGAAAGLNSLTYVPYKKCPAIMATLHKIVRKI